MLHSIMTLSITIRSIKLGIKAYDTECNVFDVMLGVVLVNAVMLSVVILGAVKPFALNQTGIC
jgi:hypothetical protein